MKLKSEDLVENVHVKSSPLASGEMVRTILFRYESAVGNRDPQRVNTGRFDRFEVVISEESSKVIGHQ